MRIRTKIWIENDAEELLLGGGRLDIFRAVARTGSLSSAARELGMSYRAVWGKVRATEKRIGVPLMEGTAGGAQHGGTRLTAEAQQLIERFARFESEAEAAIDEIGTAFLEDINSILAASKPR